MGKVISFPRGLRLVPKVPASRQEPAAGPPPPHEEGPLRSWHPEGPSLPPNPSLWPQWDSPAADDPPNPESE